MVQGLQVLMIGSQRRFNRDKWSQSANHVHLYFVWESGFTVVPQLFCYESVLIVFFAAPNTNSSTVPFMNGFLGYHLADLIDLGWSRQTEQVKMVALQSYRLVLRPLPPL